MLCHQACWTISNITAGNRQQIQAVIDANIFPVLIDIQVILMLLVTHQVILQLLSVESRVQDPEGGGVGDHERELWRHRRADQVPCAARLHTSSL